MSDNGLIQVGTQVDLSALERLNQATTDLAAKMLAADTAAKVISNTMKEFQRGTLDASTATKALAQGLQEQARTTAELATSKANLVSVEKDLAGATGNMTRNIGEARMGFQALNAEVGLRLPRALSSVAASSQLLGPILNAAFPVIVAAGFIEVISRIPEILDKMTEKAAGWTKEIEKGLDEALKANDRNLENIDKEFDKRQEYMLINLTGMAKAKQEQQNLNDSTEHYKERLREAAGNVQQLSAQLNATVKVAETIATRQGPRVEVKNVPALDKESEEYKRLSKQLEHATELQERFQARVHMLENVEPIKVQREGMKAIEEETKKAAAAAREYAERLEKVQHIQKELSLAGFSGLAAGISGKDLTGQGMEDLKKIMQVTDAAHKQLTVDIEENDKHILQNMEQTWQRTYEAAMQSVKAQEEAIDGQVQLASEAYKKQAQLAESDFALHRINSQQKLQILKDAAQQELAIKTALLQAKAQLEQSIDPDQVANVQKTLNQLALLKAQTDQTILRDTTKALEEQQAKYKQFFDTINSNMRSLITGWLQGTQSFGQAWEKMGAGMVVSTIQSLAQIAIKHAENELVTLATHKASQDAQTLATTTGNAQRQSADLLASIKSITAKAASAAAGAFDATADVPVVGPVLAPAAAAAAFTAVEAFGAMASAAGGMIVPKDGPVFVHQDERILPARYSKGLDDLVLNREAPGSQQRKGDTTHFHFGTGSITSPAANAKDLAKDLMRQLRNGRFNKR